MKSAAITLGPLAIHWYGIIITLALLAGLFISLIMARLRGQRADPLAGILLLGLLAGIIGARIWYFVFRRDFYNPDPGRVFAVWQGGLALHGALLGGILATLIYTWSRELDFWTWADICAPGLILGQAVGRVGDLVNSQDFGIPTSNAPFVVIPVENRPPQYLAYSHFTPTAGYEAGWDVAVFVMLIGLTLLQRWRPRILPAGSIFLFYLVLYGIGRIPLESLRVDSLWVADMRIAQLASGVMIGAGALFYLIRLLPRREPAPVYAAPVVQGQLTQAYLVAAARGGQAARQDAGTREWDDFDEHAGNGYLPAASALPQQGSTLELPKLSPGAPTEEAS